jgi:hypothetical protein
LIRCFTFRRHSLVLTKAFGREGVALRDLLMVTWYQ